jgi:hypothetical protein
MAASKLLQNTDASHCIAPKRMTTMYSCRHPLPGLSATVIPSDNCPFLD